MIRTAVIFLAAILGVSATAGEALNTERFLGALREVETGNQVRDGAHGERGPWQISADVWAMHMQGVPFALAREERPARLCAILQVDWISRQLTAAGVEANAFNVALAWNAGLARVLAGRAPVSSYSHALRVRNLYRDLADPKQP